jgi:flagellar protein FlaF
MAVAEIIGAAVGVLLLVVVAYMLVGNVVSTAEIVTTAQKDLTLQNEARMRTAINVSIVSVEGLALNFSVSNRGSEILHDFSHMDVYTHAIGQEGYSSYTYDTTRSGAGGTWSIVVIDKDYIHPISLDPGETMYARAYFSGATPNWVQFSTDNGVSASAVI